MKPPVMKEESVTPSVSHRMRDFQRIVMCACGASIGMGAALYALDAAHAFMLASLGGTTVFLFGLTRAPAAQPRALFGGHLGSAFIGIACYQAFGDALWVYALALVATFVYMLLTRTVHPPAGANPLIMVHSHATFAALWQPVGLGVLVLAMVAFIWSRLVPGMVHYPVSWTDRSPAALSWDCWEK